ncbi:MAG TPA: glycosyltransferase family 39 protein, partial [Anaerolineales bacterium]|nr:glycosyltransferase family 39 protein [Anaerolineales bacterium]
MRNNSAEERLARWAPVLLLALGAQFAWRSYLTHPVFNDTADEAVHIGCGLEVWERRQYTLEPQHPPLARLAVSVLPYFAGLRHRGDIPDWESHDLDFYWRTLRLARMGNLVFLPFLLLYVYRWGREIHGAAGGLAAAALVSFSPNLLAHASLATLDFGAATTLVAATWYLWQWSQRLDPRLALKAVLAFGLAVLTKFSALFLLPPIAVAFLALARTRVSWRMAVAFVTVLILLLWAGYGFSWRPLPPAQHSAPRATLQGAVQRGLERVVGRHAVPAPGLVRGLLDMLGHNAKGHQCYLLGKLGKRGWWYYFPIVLALKTTLPLLALVVLALMWGPRRRMVLYPGVAAAVVLAVCMMSNLNLGVRHILAIYPFFALLAAGLFVSPRRAARGVALVLGLWHGAESVAAHPDYLPYFNQTVRSHAEDFLLDSNLDWGQDLERLRRFLEQERIDTVYLSFFGRGHPIRQRIPGTRPLEPQDRPAGWVAVSQAHLAGLALPGPSFAWLKSH